MEAPDDTSQLCNGKVIPPSQPCKHGTKRTKGNKN